MDLTIKNKAENKALGRTVLTCEIMFDKAVPSRKEIREAICAATGADPAQLIIVSVLNRFGERRAIATAHQYATKAGAGVAKKHLLIRDGLAQKEKKAAAAKAAPAKK
jgi:ribosomal protein S24E